MILALGLSVEMLFLGLALVTDTLKGWKNLGHDGVFGGWVGICLAWQSVISGVSTDIIATVLAASAAALLYLVTEELLIEAHEVEEKNYYTLILFAGLLAFWSVQMLGAKG